MSLQKLFARFKAKTYISPVNEPIRMGTSYGKKAIFAGKIPQSGGEFIYEWNHVIKQVKEKDYTLKNCLMLGVAGGDGINALRTYYPEIHIFGIEIDPVILNLALENKLFTLDRNIKLKIADAVQWIKKTSTKYDLIIVDLYLGDMNVPAAREESFLAEVKSHLSPKGIVLYSCHYSKMKKEEYETFIKRVRKIYARVEIVFEYPKNKVLLFTR